MSTVDRRFIGAGSIYIECKEFVLFMEGLNDAQDGKPFNIRVHRIKFPPVQNLDFISDDSVVNHLSFS
ncbi:hypothetical protein [Salinisphaera sp. G21_0]|uniref:hypothetical protein n=1 Tax=Salinisphaera sp. G21_0 TaxID=2821094 RepID=UPI001ADAAF33|nr:hypothetical protein [Salinisphaera sp. G21_0]MBO9484475.1 hypothetical protein [Salinisphaera sp. G21_0]